MSAEAARVFDISRNDLLIFLGKEDESKYVSLTLETSNRTKNIIVIVSVFLFVVAVVTCICTLCLWCISKRKKKYDKLDTQSETAELACNEEFMKQSANNSLSLPQISEKPKLSANIDIHSEKDPFDEEELQKLKVASLHLSSNYYVNRERLQVNVRRVILSNVNEELSKNAYIYLVVSLTPEKKTFYESELRPVAEENYFEESSEFDVMLDELESRNLKVSVFACDRFSQHRLVNEYTYNLLPQPDDDAANSSILPVRITEIYKSPDNEIAVKDVKVGEVLFSLCYMPTSGRLTFVALKGRNVNDERNIILASYLRVSLLVSGKVMKTVQTSSVRRSTAPVYNEAFVFHTPLERIKDTDITVSVMTYSSSESSPKLLGKVTVGPESDNNLGRKHWEAMLTSPRKPVAQWHSFSNNE